MGIENNKNNRKQQQKRIIQFSLSTNKRISFARGLESTPEIEISLGRSKPVVLYQSNYQSKTHVKIYSLTNEYYNEKRNLFKVR